MVNKDIEITKSLEGLVETMIKLKENIFFYIMKLQDLFSTFIWGQQSVF